MSKVALVVMRDTYNVGEVFIFEGDDIGPLWDEARDYRQALVKKQPFVFLDATILNVSEVRDD